MGRWTILIDIFGTLLSFSISYTPAALLISFNRFHFLPRVHVLWKLELSKEEMTRTTARK